MPDKITGVAGIIEIAPLAAILALPANSAVSPKSLFFDFATGTLMTGPEGSRTAVNVTTTPVTFLNLYGTSYGSSQDETTADAPVEFGDADSFFGDDSDVTKIAHSVSFEGVYHRKEPFWKSLRVAKNSKGKDRLYYIRFFPEGKLGGAEVYHGVVEPRGSSQDFPREDYATFSQDFPYKTREFITDLPTPYSG